MIVCKNTPHAVPTTLVTSPSIQMRPSCNPCRTEKIDRKEPCTLILHSDVDPDNGDKRCKPATLEAKQLQLKPPHYYLEAHNTYLDRWNQTGSSWKGGWLAVAWHPVPTVYCPSPIPVCTNILPSYMKSHKIEDDHELRSSWVMFWLSAGWEGVILCAGCTGYCLSDDAYLSILNRKDLRPE